MLGFFFEKKDLSLIVQGQKNMLLFAMRKRSDYLGRSPMHAHKGIPPILEGHFNRRLHILRELLEEEKIPHWASKIWLSFEESFRSAIVSAQCTYF